MRITILIFIFSTLAIVGKSQSITICSNGVFIELSFNETTEEIFVASLLKNKTNEKIYINPDIIDGGYLTINDMTYLNFGASINSRLHPYLPLEGSIKLKAINPKTEYHYDTIKISKEDFHLKLRVGLDFITESGSRKNLRIQNSYYYIKSSRYKKKMNNTFIYIDFEKSFN